MRAERTSPDGLWKELLRLGSWINEGRHTDNAAACSAVTETTVIAAAVSEPGFLAGSGRTLCKAMDLLDAFDTDKGSVGAGAVRDFRGAMSGRADKGLLITTASFTGEAKQEATRDGAPPVDLIDGDRLCDLLKEYELGVRRTIRQIEEVEVVPEFFAEL
jgi:hypothetical protein